MTLTDVALSLPIPRNVLRSAARVLRPTQRARASRRIEMLGLGMALGAGVALLWAPKSGRELRRQIFARFGRPRLTLPGPERRRPSAARRRRARAGLATTGAGASPGRCSA